MFLWRSSCGSETVTGNAKSITAGVYHTCALQQDGTVKCWGRNDHGQLGDGTTTERKTPTTVPGLSGVAAIAVGELHTCALMQGGTVKCWGLNASGQLGDDTTTERLVSPAFLGQ